MTPQDQQRFAIIGDFVNSSGITPPFHLVAIGSNGSVPKIRTLSERPLRDRHVLTSQIRDLLYIYAQLGTLQQRWRFCMIA
jgi:hypothetical protein